MKKLIVALAVSSAALASLSVYSTEDPSLYGNINYAGVTTFTPEHGLHYDLRDNGSYLGVKGESKVSDSVTALFKYELQFQADQQAKRNDTKGYNQAHLKQAFVGLKSDFGKVTYGTHDTIYNNAIQDPVAPMQYIAADHAANSSQGNTITYFSPSVNGLEMQVALQHKGTQRKKLGSEVSGNAAMAVLKYSSRMFNVAVGYDSKLSKVRINHFIGCSYILGQPRVFAVPQRWQDILQQPNVPLPRCKWHTKLPVAEGFGWLTTPLPTGVCSSNAPASVNAGMALTVLPMANLSVTATYENQANAAAYLGLAARYGYGVGKEVYTAYTNINPAASDENTYNDFAAGVTYNVNRAIKVYTEVAYQGKAKSSKKSAIFGKTTSAVGVNYKF